MTWLSDETVHRLRAAAEAPDLEGTRYRIMERIGRGGMGAVYLAEDVSLGRRVALKVLDVSDPSGELAARLLREARILARLEHPGIVPVHDVGTLADGRVFYTMKFVQGARLDQHLGQATALSDRLRIFQRICEAVAFAHSRGILHRDIKPENIMVGPFGEVLVMDWGLAKVLRDAAWDHRAELDDDSAGPALRGETPGGPQSPTARSEATPTDFSVAETAHGAVLGTPGYMAPEQARGEVRQLDERADVYALGAILHGLLIGPTAPGATPTQTTQARGSTPRAGAPGRVRSGASRPLMAICAKAMAAEPDQRYASAQELADDVARYLDRLPVKAYPENILRRARRLYERHRVAVILILVYAVARALIVIFLGR